MIVSKPGSIAALGADGRFGYSDTASPSRRLLAFGRPPSAGTESLSALMNSSRAPLTLLAPGPRSLNAREAGIWGGVA